MLCVEEVEGRMGDEGEGMVMDIAWGEGNAIDGDGGDVVDFEADVVA